MKENAYGRHTRCENMHALQRWYRHASWVSNVFVHILCINPMWQPELECAGIYGVFIGLVSENFDYPKGAFRSCYRINAPNRNVVVAHECNATTSISGNSSCPRHPPPPCYRRLGLTLTDNEKVLERWLKLHAAYP